MKTVCTVAAAMIITGAAGFALAHGGGIDSCGGHNDRKRGGYHVHQWGRYCACYSGGECKNDR